MTSTLRSLIYDAEAIAQEPNPRVTLGAVRALGRDIEDTAPAVAAMAHGLLAAAANAAFDLVAGTHARSQGAARTTILRTMRRVAGLLRRAR